MFLAIVAIGFVSCEKKEINGNIKFNNPITKSENQFKSDGRMLIFETTQDFQNFVTLSNKETKSSFYKNITLFNHKTYAELLSEKSNENDLINDEDLSIILNNDLIVQIGNYIYRVNKPTEYVYVLHTSNISEYQDLVNENTTNKNIRKFSTEDNVIELAESGAEGYKGLFCGEGGVGSRSDHKVQGDKPNNTTGVYTTLRHSKYGIYFTIVIETSTNYAFGLFKYEFPTNSNERRFKRRCQSVEYVPYSVTFQWSSMTNVDGAKYKIKENFTNFSKYHIRARCNYYSGDLFSTQFALISTSQWLEIRVNY